VSTSYSLTSGKAGANFAVLGISRDVTERKRREDQMYHTEKLASLGTLAAGVAHEINNPLAVILGFTDMLLGKTPPESEAYDILKTIEKQGNNAKRVVENLLSFARYRDSREELIEINNNIEEVLTVAGNTLRVSKIVVQKQLAKDLPAIKGDSRELQQVFLNIINNAIYAMKGHGILTVTTGRTANGVEIRLADTGHGIKKEDRNKIFDPLFTTKEVGEGTGLGLSVCYAIVAKYGGTITFETRTADESPETLGRVELDDSSTIVDLSADNGKPLTGTTFIITLPVVND
jgi:signal transduction histidine kinase